MTETQVAATPAPEAHIPTEADLLKMAADLDNGVGSEPQAEPLAPAGEGTKPQDNGAAAPNEQAADTKTDTGKPEATPAKPDKAQREQERRERSWKALEEQKAQFRKEQEDLARQKAELEAQRKTAEPKSEADAYERIAKQYEAEGNDDLAKLARERATELRARETQERTAAEQRKLEDSWNQQFAELRDKDPEVGDRDSDTFKRMSALIQAEPWLYQVPGGLKKAHTFVRNQLDAEAASGLRKSVEEQKQRISELEKKLALGGSYPTAPQGEKTFEQMNHSEQEQYLRRQAMQLDGEV